jgi:hypothetical protein
MTKKDEKDADRPHYYSQFWLDVAAGRRVIGTPRTEEGSDQTGRAASVDGYQETRSPGAAEPAEEEEYSEPEPEEEVELASDLNDEDIPNIVVEDFPEKDLISLEPATIDEEEETEEPDEEDEFFDEEEEDDDEWAARGRKKPKPGRQVKQPKPPVKKPKRGGRGF